MDEHEEVVISDDTTQHPKNPGLISNSRFYSQIFSNSTLATLDTSNSEYLSQLPNYHVDGSFGVDMIRISLMLDPNSVVHADFLSNIYKSDGNKTYGKVKLPGQPSVYMAWPDTGKEIISISFNPSNFSRIDGFEICPPYLLGKYVEHVIRAVLNLGDPEARPGFMEDAEWGELGPWPQNWSSHIKISLLHLARDFTVLDPRFCLEQMARFKPVRMGAVKLIPGTDGRVETVTHSVGKDTARHQVYDKHKERKKVLGNKKQVKAVSAPIPEGTFRYEVQIPRVALRKSNIITLDLLTPERIDKISLSYWESSNYHSPLVWDGQIITHLQQTMTDTEIAEALQYLRNQSLGVKMRYSKSEVRRIENLIKKAKISKKRELALQGQPYAHLDFVTGGLIYLIKHSTVYRDSARSA